MEKEKKKELTKKDDKVLDKLEEMDNKLERIKSDTHSLNRVACIANATVIRDELWKVVLNSEIRAAILFLTKDEISFQDLAKTLHVKSPNLSRELKPFMGNKGFIAELKKGQARFYQRSEQIDLSAFEKEEKYIKLLESWKAKQVEALQNNESVQPKEEADAV